MRKIAQEALLDWSAEPDAPVFMSQQGGKNTTSERVLTAVEKAREIVHQKPGYQYHIIGPADEQHPPMSPYPPGEGFVFNGLRSVPYDHTLDGFFSDFDVHRNESAVKVDDSWWDHQITYSDPEPTRSQRLWAWIKRGFQNE